MYQKPETYGYYELIRQLPHVLYSSVVSQHCTLTSVTEQCLKWLGYTPEELLRPDTECCRDLIHPEDREAVSKKRRLLLGNECVNTMEYRLIDKSGNIIPVVDRWISYRSTGDDSWTVEGELTKAMGGEIKSRLIHQLKAYRDAVDVNLISSITDASGKIIYANENFCKISKYTVTELIGQNHRIICSGYHPKTFYANMWKTISSGGVWQDEILNRAKDGSLYWVDTVIMPIFDDQKRIEKYLSLRMLITDRKRSEEQRNTYTQSLEKIAFMVAHEIRGPLCSILGLAHLLANHNMTPKESALAIGHLRDVSLKMNEITQRLSQFVFENEIQVREALYADKIQNGKGYIKRIE